MQSSIYILLTHTVHVSEGDREGGGVGDRAAGGRGVRGGGAIDSLHLMHYVGRITKLTIAA